MARRKKLTKNQIEFKKQQARIKRFIKRAEKRGYEFNENVIPQMPKRVTQKALKTITNMKPNTLYEKAFYVDKQTGEYITGIEQRKNERRKAAEKAKQTRELKKKRQYYNAEYYTRDYIHTDSADVIINNIFEELDSFPKKLTSTIKQLIKNLIHTNGKQQVAEMWQNLPEKFSECLARFHYDYENAIRDFSTQIINHMPDITDATKKDMMDDFEYYESGFEIED